MQNQLKLYRTVSNKCHKTVLPSSFFSGVTAIPPHTTSVATADWSAAAFKVQNRLVWTSTKACYASAVWQSCFRAALHPAKTLSWLRRRLWLSELNHGNSWQRLKVSVPSFEFPASKTTARTTFCCKLAHVWFVIKAAQTKRSSASTS